MVAANQYDLFVVHADADAYFVRGHLIPAVGVDPKRTLLSGELSLGASRVAEIERGIERSRITIVVLSPAYLIEHWTVFGEQLATHARASDGGLIPLLLDDCDVPLHLDFVVGLDLRDRQRWPEQIDRLRVRLQQPAPSPVVIRCPYPGLRPFSEADVERFHGREALVDDIVERIRLGEREIYVIGPSGSGKSSLVSAGLLPRLAAGVSGLPSFTTVRFRPASPPSNLRHLIDGRRNVTNDALLLSIDQLEEVFVADETRRLELISTIASLRESKNCVVVLTLRADFFGALMESALWRDDGKQLSRVEVAPLRSEALRKAIEAPARSVGVYFEPALVERLSNEAAKEPGALPLLQETLVQLWDRRRIRLITLSDYERMGDGDRTGMAVAISRRADACMRRLSADHQRIARRILLRLVNLVDGHADTRRQQARSHLASTNESKHDFQLVLNRLIENHLVTTDTGDRADPLVDLAHEVMISAWPSLAEWIHIRRLDEQRRRQLEAAARTWQANGSTNRGLLDELELAEAHSWRQSESAAELGVTAAVTALINASGRAHSRAKYRKRALAIGVIAGLSLAVTLVSWSAIRARRLAGEAASARDEAEQRRWAAEKLAEVLSVDENDLKDVPESLGRAIIEQNNSISQLPKERTPREITLVARAMERLGTGSVRTDPSQAILYYTEARSLLETVTVKSTETRTGVARLTARLAAAEQMQGKLDDAAREYSVAISAFSELHTLSPQDTSLHRELGAVHDSLGDLYRNKGQLGRAKVEYEAAVEIRRKWIGIHNDINALNATAKSETKLGGLAVAVGSLEQAQRHADEALRLRLEVRAHARDPREQDMLVSDAYNERAEILRTQGKHDEAVNDYESALAYMDSSVSSAIGATTERGRVVLQTDLGLTLLDAGDASKALKVLDRALEDQQALVMRDPINTRSTVDLVRIWWRVGEARSQLGDTSRAIDAQTKALELSSALASRDPGNISHRRFVGSSQARLARIYLVAGMKQKALSVAKAVVGLREQLTKTAPSNDVLLAEVAEAYGIQANIEAKLGRTSEANGHFDRAIDIARSIVIRDALAIEPRKRLATWLVERSHANIRTNRAASLQHAQEAVQLTGELMKKQPDNTSVVILAATAHWLISRLRVGDAGRERAIARGLLLPIHNKRRLAAAHRELAAALGITNSPPP